MLAKKKSEYVKLFLTDLATMYQLNINKANKKGFLDNNTSIN